MLPQPNRSARTTAVTVQPNPITQSARKIQDEIGVTMLAVSITRPGLQSRGACAAHLRKLRNLRARRPR